LKPDIPNLIWIDPRLIADNTEVNNKERVLFAARKLYSNYIMTTSSENNWASVKKNIAGILSQTITEAELHLVAEQQAERIEKYKKLLREFGAEEDYHPEKWFNDAILEEVKKEQWNLKDLSTKEFHFRDNYQKSNWYNFQEAAKQYLKNAEIILRPLLSSLEMKEW